METKFWLNSTTIRALLLGLLPTAYQLAKVLGLDLPDGLLEQSIDGVSAITSLASIIWAFIGRIKAEKPLSF